MRTLYLLRGAPASGKSTWIKENHLEAYTLSADQIRLMVQSPVMNNEGQYVITQKNDNKVWSLLLDMLENRMSRGEFCIVDATHYKLELIRKYKDLVTKYRYRVFIVNFTDVPLCELKCRNDQRSKYKYVPEEVIEKMHSVFQNEDIKQIPSSFKVLTRKEAIKKLKEDPIFDFNNYQQVVVIPDIHGCFEPLRTYFKENPFNNDTFYVFLGDYIDRGLQNKEVLEFLFSIMNNKNVLLLEGNHEKWLRKYCAKEEKIKFSQYDLDLLSKVMTKSDLYDLKNKYKYSSEFEKNTIPQIEDIDKTLLRKFCDKLGQFAYFKFGNNVYCLTHGGISNKPSIFTSTCEFINGVGKYEENEKIYEYWTRNTPDNYIQIHGHRNVYNIDPKFDDKNYNLNSSVEYGEDMRIMTIDKNGANVSYYKNPVFNEKEIKREILYVKTEDELYKALNENKHIVKKELKNNVVSYNFSRDAFDKGIWNNIITKARGLFINKKTQNVVARSYDKFFNLFENDETSYISLKNNLSFPVNVYLKENGFLGMVSWDKDNDELFIASKSTNEGPFADLARKHFNDLENKDKIIKWLKENDYTLIFEVIDKYEDPHIIEYDESKMVLLDIVKNWLFKYENLKYEELVTLSQEWHLNLKKSLETIENWNDLRRKLDEEQTNDKKHIEGYVFVDQNNFMFKFKTPFYKFWKYMRSIKDAIVKDRNIRQTFINKLETDVILFMKNMDKEKLNNMSIIDVRNEFYKEKR